MALPFFFCECVWLLKKKITKTSLGKEDCPPHRSPGSINKGESLLDPIIAGETETREVQLLKAIK